LGWGSKERGGESEHNPRKGRGKKNNTLKSFELERVVGDQEENLREQWAKGQRFPTRLPKQKKGWKKTATRRRE